MSKMIIAFDIDGTIRNLNNQLQKYLEIDYPDKLDKFKENKDIYNSLDNLFDTKEDLYSWMYEERVFELFGMAGRTHPKVIDDLNIFSNAARNVGIDIVIASVQRNQSITATLHWLSKWGCKIQRYEFFSTMDEKIERNFDFYIDDCPKVLNSVVGESRVPNHCEKISGISRAIKIPYSFTNDIDCPSLDIANGKFDDIYEIFSIEKILKK